MNVVMIMIIYININIKIYALEHIQKYLNFYAEIQIMEFISQKKHHL